MTLEQQVCSLDLAKRLKELGVKQESFFCWSVSDLQSMTPEVTTTLYAGSIHGKGFNFSAFTVAELGEMLKNGTHWDNPNFASPFPEWSGRLGKWESELPKGAWITCDTEADARAKMLIYLIENKLITA